MEGLKPCPFCGDDVLLKVVTDQPSYMERYGMEGYTEVFVYCPSCGAQGPRVSRAHYSLITCKAEAAQRWNRRVQA